MKEWSETDEGIAFLLGPGIGYDAVDESQQMSALYPGPPMSHFLDDIPQVYWSSGEFAPEVKGPEETIASESE